MWPSNTPTLSCWLLENSVKYNRGTPKNSPKTPIFSIPGGYSSIHLLSSEYLGTEATCWAIHWCSSPWNASSLTFRYITPVIPVLSLIPVTKQYWKCWWSMSVCSTAQINIKAAIKNPHQAGASLFLMKPINTLFFRRLGKEKEKETKIKNTQQV